jgi:RHS repeat-associated protein
MITTQTHKCSSATVLRVLAAALTLFWVQVVTAGETITYFHNDIIGSPAMATDANGLQAWKETYRPYGDQLIDSAASQNDKIGFAGKPFDDSTGLSYMGARYYDPTLGRFMAVDPVSFSFDNLHSFNRYAYANDNPYRFVDPDGQESKVAWLVRLAGTSMKKVARLTQEQAVRARRAEQNVVADRRQIARQIEEAADNGQGNVIKHAAHELKDGSKGLPHYQSDRLKGHTFWGTLSVAALAVAEQLDETAEAADAVDPLNYLSSGDTGEIEGYERTWFGANKKVDPNAPDFIEAVRQKQERDREERRRQEKSGSER